MSSNALPAHTVLMKCEECGKRFPKTRDWSAYCSDVCRWESWKQTHVRLHRADLFTVIGKDWQAKLAAARLARKQKEPTR